MSLNCSPLPPVPHSQHWAPNRRLETCLFRNSGRLRHIAAVGSAGMADRARICPSLLASDWAHLAEESKRVLSLGADWLHYDVMDGHFVDNLTVGAPVLSCLHKAVPEAFLDCHLMVTDPEALAPAFRAAGASQLTVHIEALGAAAAAAAGVAAPAWGSAERAPALDTHIADTLRRLRAGGRVGLALRPGTHLAHVLPFAALVDLVLVMTVEPGWGGQAFMPEQLAKVRTLRAAHPHLDIQVDGGLTDTTTPLAAHAGANVIVAGSAIFKSADPAATMRHMREAVVAALEGSEAQ